VNRRRRDDDELEEGLARLPPPVPVGQMLDHLVRHLGWAERTETVGALARWDEIVGPAIAAHARPVALDAGTLTVAVDDPAWASQLKWLERSLIEQLAAGGIGPLDRLVVRVRQR
jgi:predicted nucleic acid-binding Zn ribbon protein